MKKTVIILIVFMLVVMSLAGCSGTNDEDIIFVLDWTPNTNHTGIYVALDKGYFADEGLSVNIIQPSSGTAEQLVAANTAQFGISYQENVTFARAQGMPLVSLAAVIQHNSSGFLSMKSENITDPSGFSGKKYGGWGTEIETATVKYLMEAIGADSGTVKIVTIGETDFFAASHADEIDFAWIFEAWTLVEAKLRGLEVNYFNMTEYAEVFDYYTPVIITNEENIEINEKMVEKFMKATVKGYEFAIENPEAAADILLKYAPELDVELVKESQKILASKYQDDAEYWGLQKQKIWKDYTEWLYENGFIDELIDSEDAFTNAYVK